MGQPGLDAASRCCIGHLSAHTPLLGQTQNKQGRHQERTGRTWHNWTGRKGVLPAWGLGAGQTTPVPSGQVTRTSDGLDSLSVQRSEFVSLGSCRKTRGPEEAARGWDGPGPCLTKPSPTGDSGIAWTKPEPVLQETQGTGFQPQPGENADPRAALWPWTLPQ